MVRRAPVTVAILLLAAAVWWLWPATLGGHTTYFVTQGVSMEPRFHSGDLAVIRPADGYGVGDVVAYRSETLKTVVLHRIVAVEAGRFQTRGDNNSWLDPDHVPASDVLGRLVARVPHGGDVLVQARNPGVLAVGSVLVTLTGALVRRLRRRRRSTSRWSRPPLRHAAARSRPPLRHAAGRQPLTLPRAADQRLLPNAIVVATSVGAALLCVGVLAWIVPTAQLGSRSVDFTQRATLAYRASVPASPAYPAGEVKTGDPVYLALVPALDVAASYRLTTSAPAVVAGTRSVEAVLSTADGWSRTVTLVPAGRFRTGGFDVTAHLDMAQFTQIIKDVQAATQVPIGGYTLTVRVDVHLTGAVAAQRVDEQSAPALVFTVDDRVARLAQTQSGTKTTAGGQLTETSGSVRVPQRVPGAFALAGHRVQAGDLRWWPLATGVVLLLVSLGLAGMVRRGRPAGSDVALSRYRDHLLDAEPVAPAADRTVIELDSMDALARVAERYERFIVHSSSGAEHDFLVDDGSTLYRYRTGEVTEPVLLSHLPRQRSPQEAAPDAEPAATPRDVGDQVTAFVERLRRSAVDQD